MSTLGDRTDFTRSLTPPTLKAAYIWRKICVELITTGDLFAVANLLERYLDKFLRTRYTITVVWRGERRASKGTKTSGKVFASANQVKSSQVAFN